MKRAIVIIMLVVLLSVSMCGCNEAEAGNRRLWILDASPRYYEIYVDNLTGVQYLQNIQRRRVRNGRHRGEAADMGGGFL